MSWTKIFPVLDETMLEKAREGRNEEDRAEFEQHFGVLAEHRPHQHRSKDAQASNPALTVGKRHLVSTTLFWKHVNGKDPDLPSPTRERLDDARRLGLVKRFSPWESYLEPLFLHSAQVMARHP